MSLAQLRTEGPARSSRWLADKWLRTGGTSLWSGKPKSGKSTLLQQLVVATATGRSFLGRQVQQGLACIFLLDGDSKDETRIRLDAMIGGSQQFDENIALATFMKYTKPEHAAQHLREEIGDLRPALIVLDTLGAYLGMDTLDKYGEMRARLREVAALAEELDCHVAVTHHDKKKEAASASDRANGSTAIGGGFEALVSVQMTSEGKQTVECPQHRYGDGYPKTQLSFDSTTFRSLPFGTMEELRTQAVEARADDLRGQVLSVLHVDGRVDRSTLLAKLTGMASRKLTAIKSLVDDCAISVTGAGISGDPYIYALTAQLQEAA